MQTSRAELRTWTRLLVSMCTAIAALLLVAAVMLGGTKAALADGVVSGPCTEAQLTAALAGGGLVTFSCASPLSITFSVEKVITAPTTIDGANGGLGQITFDGGGNVRLFRVAAGAQLTLVNGLALVHGSAPAQGGAILVEAGGILSVRGARFEGNQAANHGGAIGNYGEAVIGDSQFLSNSAPLNGGAIDSTGSLTLAGNSFDFNHAGSRGGAVNNTLGVLRQSPDSGAPSTFIHNSSSFEGGALMNDQGTLSLAAQFSDNHSNGAGGAFKNSGQASITGTFALNSSATADGGAIWSNAPLLVASSVFTSNQANQGGAIYTNALLTVTQSTFDTNFATLKGGAIFVAAPAHLTARASVFRGQIGALEGVTIYAFGPAEIEASTFHDNGSDLRGNGGAIETLVRLDLLNSTFSQNHGYHAGALLMKAGLVFITNTTFVSNTAGDGGLNGGSIMPSAEQLTPSLHILNSVLVGGVPNNCTYALTSLGGNAEDANSCGLNQPGDQPSINARLGPLQANGGASGTEPLTHMPLPGSPLIDAALLSGCPPLDQLGRSRPDGPGCDVGAVETTPEITPVITWHLFLPLIQR